MRSETIEFLTEAKGKTHHDRTSTQKQLTPKITVCTTDLFNCLFHDAHIVVTRLPSIAIRSIQIDGYIYVKCLN